MHRVAVAGSLVRFVRAGGGTTAGRDIWGHSVNGRRFLPMGGHRFSPVAAMSSPHWWPLVLPGGVGARVLDVAEAVGRSGVECPRGEAGAETQAREWGVRISRTPHSALMWAGDHPLASGSWTQRRWEGGGSRPHGSRPRRQGGPGREALGREAGCLAPTHQTRESGHEGIAQRLSREERRNLCLYFAVTAQTPSYLTKPGSLGMTHMRKPEASASGSFA